MDIPKFSDSGRTVIDKIEFIIEKDLNEPNGPFVIRTEKNPYIFVGQNTKFDVVVLAFTKYLERLFELEHPELVAQQRAAQLLIDQKNAGTEPGEHTDSNGEKNV